MKNIYCAPVIQMGSGSEYYLGQADMCKDSQEWDGNVIQFVFDKFDYDSACSSVNAEYSGIICDLPKNSVVLAICDKPIVAYWAQED